jgi:hypothetical protein
MAGIGMVNGSNINLMNSPFSGGSSNNENFRI